MDDVNPMLHFVHHHPERLVESDGNSFNIRYFRYPQDITAWLQLRRRTFARQRVSPQAWTTEDFYRELSSRSWWAPERTWVVEAGQGETAQLIGAVTLAERLHGNRPVGVLLWLMVDPHWRGRGLGEQLAARLHHDAVGRGYAEIWLETHPAWTDAIRLYWRLGYKQVAGPPTASEQ